MQHSVEEHHFYDPLDAPLCLTRVCLCLRMLGPREQTSEILSTVIFIFQLHELRPGVQSNLRGVQTPEGMYATGIGDLLFGSLF